MPPGARQLLPIALLLPLNEPRLLKEPRLPEPKLRPLLTLPRELDMLGGALRADPPELLNEWLPPELPNE
jgi:hypothetical protein